MTANTSTALITGGTSGIGRATAKKLAQMGIHVVVVGRNVERGKMTVDEIRAGGGNADFISSDLRDAASARAVAKKAIELGSGLVNILINNAGIFPFGPTHEMSEEDFDRVFSLNVKAPYFLVAELAPLMAKKGKGAIVNVSTMVADYGVSGMSLYGASKAAINLLTKSWAAEYGRSGVRVNTVSPGPTRTEGTDAMGEGLEALASQAPAGRPANPDEIAEAIVFLATDRATSSMAQSSPWMEGALLSDKTRQSPSSRHTNGLPCLQPCSGASTAGYLRVRITCRAIGQFECERERFLLSAEFGHNELSEFHCTGRNVTIGDPPYA